MIPTPYREERITLPELPEVETVRRVLAPQLCGRRVTSVTAARPEVVAYPRFSEFRRGTEAAVIRQLGRRGKFLLIHFSDGATLVLHLRMTGQLICAPADFPAKPHTHVIFGLDGGSELRFIDTRRFGRLWLIAPGLSDTFTGMDKLGPEPFDAEFGPDYLERRLEGRRIAVKQALLDQSFVAGIGNIYADESLFAAKIDPRRPAGGLTKQEWRGLAAAIPHVLERAIAGNAVTPEEYLAGEGKEYKHNDFFVYGREGQKCRRCGAAIKRIKIAGRSSSCCLRCQK